MDKEYIITDGVLQHASAQQWHNTYVNNQLKKNFKYKTKYKSKNGNWVYVYDTPKGTIGASYNKGKISIQNRNDIGTHVTASGPKTLKQLKMRRGDAKIIESVTGEKNNKARKEYEQDRYLKKEATKAKIKYGLQRTAKSASASIAKGKKAASSFMSKLRSKASSAVKKAKSYVK